MLSPGFGRRGGIVQPDETDENNWKVTLSAYEEGKEIVEATEAEAASPPAAESGAGKDAKELASDAVGELLNRVPAVSATADDEQNFAAREASLKAPKTGKVISVPFPAPEAARAEMTIDPKDLARISKAEAGPLTIQRYSPQGWSALSLHPSRAYP